MSTRAELAAQRALSEAKKRRRRVKHVERTYGVCEPALEALEAYQDGRCWGCRRATGAAKALALDHDHATGEARMLLCGPCNQLIGRYRDDPVALIRLGLALIDPPSRSAWLAPGRPAVGFGLDPADAAELEVWLASDP